MSIIDNVADIAAEIKRLKAEQQPAAAPSDEKPPGGNPMDAMRAYLEQLYGTQLGKEIDLMCGVPQPIGIDAQTGMVVFDVKLPLTGGGEPYGHAEWTKVKDAEEEPKLTYDEWVAMFFGGIGWTKPPAPKWTNSVLTEQDIWDCYAR